MKIIQSIREMQQISIQHKRKGHNIGLVPTMGYLHKGHTSLIEIARRHADVVVVSVFVNLLQFGLREDFNSYPRDIQRDREIAEQNNVDYIFTPSNDDMYPTVPLTRVKVLELDRFLCGPLRPGHFEGVTTVVAKLYNIILPDIAVFGLKDYQQYKVIEQMTQELHYPIKIIPGSTIREKDGLAMSSRNKNLSHKERKVAHLLYQGLNNANTLYQSGKRDAETLLPVVRQSLLKSSLFHVEYIELVDGKYLSPKKEAQKKDVIAAAVYLGKVRLIDKIILE